MTEIRYGKAGVSVYRTDGVSRLLGAEVRIDVYGDNFLPAYTEGDNSLVVPTDTMKNLIHLAALDYEGDSLEGLVEHVGRRFLATYDHLERITLHARELPFARRSDVLFQRLHDDAGIAELTLGRRDGVLGHRSGREGLHLIKITGSSFARFRSDEFTTLPEMVDRPLFVRLDCWWRHDDPARPVVSEAVRDLLVATFDDFNSRSIQHLVHEMGTRALTRFPELAEIELRAENRLWDTAQVSAADDRVKVYTDPRPPYGEIALTLRR
jgi:urate oxidase / 2-oxo-4-hydroxy-4-carboxy-5-ureidoimidazoline decarboxylase